MPVIDEASTFYTELYDMPFEIHTKPNLTDMVAEPKSDAVYVYVPETTPLYNKEVETDQDEERYDEFLEFLELCATEYRDNFNTIEEQFSESELEGVVKEWARTIDVPMPDVKVGKFSRNLAQFTTGDGAGLIEFQPQVLYLPMRLAEGLTVHELCHAKRWHVHYTQANGDYKEALRTFREEDFHGKLWQDEFSKHIPNWQQLDDEVDEYFDELYS